MGLSEDLNLNEEDKLTTSKRRRLRRKKLRDARNVDVTERKNIIPVKSTYLIRPSTTSIHSNILEKAGCNFSLNGVGNNYKELQYISKVDSFITSLENVMSSKGTNIKSKDEVLAARQAKKSNKQKAKQNNEAQQNVIKLPDKQTDNVQALPNVSNELGEKLTELSKTTKSNIKLTPKDPKLKESSKPAFPRDSPKGDDEVDRAVLKDNSIKLNVEKAIQLKDSQLEEVNVLEEPIVKENKLDNIGADKSKEQIKAERAAKKANKQAKKKVVDNVEVGIKKHSIESTTMPLKKEKTDVKKSEVTVFKNDNLPSDKDVTVREVVETLKDIVNVAKDFQAVTDKVKAIDLGGNKSDENVKSKAELKAERRAKQEAQRAAKQAQQKPTNISAEKDKKEIKNTQKVPGKPKPSEKPKTKAPSVHRVNWFQHLYIEHDKEALKKIAINSNIHPAVIKLGVQLASQVVTGSNARCIALLDALKKMVRDYSLPAKTEFKRGLESHLAASLEFLWAMRQPSASQTNAVKHFRRQLMQLPDNFDEFLAKKTLEEDIDRYIREQIDMAGEAISIAVRNKISNGDNILTYGCSSLIERILCEAWESGLRFRAVVAGDRVRRGAREMLRRLASCGLPCTYADISAVSFLMGNINKVILGAGALLVNGSVLGPVGTAQVALVARSHNVPVLVACETHKFSERVQTDAFVYNEIGDPDDLIDKTDENSPLKGWRSNPNMTLLNLTYDVTPPSLVTAVVTELAILPCTSAPVVLRIKPSEYSLG